MAKLKLVSFPSVDVVFGVLKKSAENKSGFVGFGTGVNAKDVVVAGMSWLDDATVVENGNPASPELGNDAFVLLLATVSLVRNANPDVPLPLLLVSLLSVPFDMAIVVSTITCDASLYLCMAFVCFFSKLSRCFL